MRISLSPQGRVGGTAGSIQMMYGDTFEQLGAVSRGEVLGQKNLVLRFASNNQAAAVAKILEPSVDDVSISVLLQNGKKPSPSRVSAASIADAVEGVRGVLSARLTGDDTPTFEVAVANHETAQRLDWIFRDQLLGSIPLRFVISKN